MTLEDKQWLDNRLTGEKKAVTSCGRCVANVKKTIKHYYDQERSNS